MNARQLLDKTAEFNGTQGSCPDAPSNLVRLNEVRALIYDRHDCSGTVDWICINVCNGCFYLPVEFEKILSIYTCGKPIPLHGRFSVIGRAMAQKHCGCEASVLATGVRNAIADDLPRPVQIRVTNDNPEDNGVQFHIWKSQSTDKETYELFNEGFMLNGSFRGVRAFSKPVTKGAVILWGIDSDNSERVIAEFPPSSEDQKFAQFRLSGARASQILLCLKRKCLPIVDLDEPLDIQNLQAIKFGYQAFNKQQKDDDAGYASKIRLMDNALDKADTALQTDSTDGTPHVRYSSGRAVL